MLFDNVDKPRSKQTEYLLKSIAARLSGRDDCKKIPYKITIDAEGVNMFPIVYVYPNRYTRKEADKIDVVSFVHHYKMNNVLLSDFVFGTYEYQLSPDGKRRKWRKVK